MISNILDHNSLNTYLDLAVCLSANFLCVRCKASGAIYPDQRVRAWNHAIACCLRKGGLELFAFSRICGEGI